GAHLRNLAHFFESEPVPTHIPRKLLRYPLHFQLCHLQKRSTPQPHWYTRTPTNRKSTKHTSSRRPITGTAISPCLIAVAVIFWNAVSALKSTRYTPEQAGSGYPDTSCDPPCTFPGPD